MTYSAMIRFTKQCTAISSGNNGLAIQSTRDEEITVNRAVILAQTMQRALKALRQGKGDAEQRLLQPLKWPAAEIPARDAGFGL